MFVDNGEDDTRAFLAKYKVRPGIMDRMINHFYKRYSGFTGKNSRVPASDFEQEIEEKLIDKGIFYRRQVPYKEILDTDKRFIMDFLVEGRRAKTIIEIPDCSDDIYLDRLRQKEELAMANGINFLLIPHGKAHYIDPIKQGLKPAQAYDLGEIDFERLEIMPALANINKNIDHNPSKTHFCKEVYMMGYVK